VLYTTHTLNLLQDAANNGSLAFSYTYTKERERKEKKMTEKIEKEEKKDITPTAEELLLLAKKEKVLDWLWGSTVKRKVLGLLRNKRGRTKAHG
jgi:hypothetical protein